MTAATDHATAHRSGCVGAVVATPRRGIGRARALALDTALAGTGLPAERVWLATTDADTILAGPRPGHRHGHGADLGRRASWWRAPPEGWWP